MKVLFVGSCLPDFKLQALATHLMRHLNYCLHFEWALLLNGQKFLKLVYGTCC